ncbi:MAG: homocysteine S-methyltransferase, partial [Bacteroidota bacterium]
MKRRFLSEMDWKLMWPDFLDTHDLMFLDGGFATELEHDGHDLRHPLWSAKLLLEDEAALKSVHYRYLEAGADCIIAATYQATVQGLTALGHTPDQATQILLRAVALATETRDQFIASSPNPDRHPLVAASIGPYGAYLADGSEFTGDYGLSRADLRAFHLPRWRILQSSGADLFACETVPSLLEAEVLADLFATESRLQGWISFSCRDGQHLCDGTPIAEAARLLRDAPGVAAMGINCTAPGHIADLLRCAREAGYDRP